MDRLGDVLRQGGYLDRKTTEAQSKSTETKMANQETITRCEEMKAELGYSPNPDCSVCRGFGFVHPRLEDDKPNYSTTIPCQAPGCLADQKRIYESTEPYMRAKGVSKFNTFENFNLVMGAETALEAFKDIAFNPEAPPLLLVYGPTGNGKTHLCEATGTELLKRGIDTSLWAVADLVGRLKESISENTTELLVGKLKAMPALILDDWGQNYGSQWEEQKLEEIVIARDRQGLITIITSNLEVDQMPERVVSRARDAVEARVILNKAGDYRPKKKRKKKPKEE